MVNEQGHTMQTNKHVLPEMQLVPGDAAAGPLSDSLFHVMWRQAWIILACVGVVGVAGLVYLLKATPIYTSTSRVYVEQSGPKIMKDLEGGVMTGSKNYLYTQAELMKAGPVVSQALQKCDAQRLKAFENVDNPVEFMKKELDVQVGKKDDILNVSLDSPYPAENAQVINAVVDAYITFNATQKRSTAVEVLKILQKEKATRDSELSAQLAALMQFKEGNETLAFQTQQGNMVLYGFDRLAAALSTAQLATLDAKSRFDAAQAMADDPAGLRQFFEAHSGSLQSWNDRTEAAQLKARLRDLQQERLERARLVTENHPAIQTLDSQIAQVMQEIDAVDATRDKEYTKAQLAVLKQEYLTAKEKQDQLAVEYDEVYKKATDLNKVVAQYTLLESKYEQTKKLCDILDERIRELNVTEDTGALNITILEAARPATKPSSPQRAKVMALALVLGLMLGGGLALAREMTDHRLHTADEVTALLGAPVLGMVPAMPKKETPAERGRIVANEPRSSVAEAFRTIRTAVFFSLPRDRSKIIQVTSGIAGEGKSTFVSNLGIAMAQSGQTVLIVDADLRKPVQNQFFEVGRDVGLSGVLAGVHRTAQAIVKTSVPGLHLLPAGPDTPNPAEMLGSKVFGVLLAKLAQNYDRVLVDSPPVGPVADACVLATQCHATLFVARAGVCTRHSVLYARDSLASVGSRVIGVVINSVTRAKGWQYGYGGYGRYGHYGNTADSQGEGNNGKREGLRPLNAESSGRRLGAVRTSPEDTDFDPAEVGLDRAPAPLSGPAEQ